MRGGRFTIFRWATLGLTTACASAPAPEPPSPPPAIPASVAEAARPSAAPSDDPCASIYLCIDQAEARADVDPLAAEAALETCLDCPHASPSGYRLLADLARGRGDRAKARLVLLEGRRRFPASASLVLALGRLERDEGRIASAMALYREGARAHPRDEVLAREYEALLAEHGTEAQRREAELQPLLREAAGRFELGDVEGARQTLELALERASNLPLLSARLHHRLALVELASGRYPAAADHARRGLQAAADDEVLRFELLLTLGEVRMAEGRWRLALSPTRAALEIDGDNPLAWANVALCQSALGQMDDAIAAFTTAVDRGLPRRLTYNQLAGLGMPFERLSADPRFEAVLVRGWPALAEGD